MAETRTRVHLHGELHNLLRGELVLVDRGGRPRMQFPVERTASIYWLDHETKMAGAHNMVRSVDLHPHVTGETEVIGWLNDSIGLVRPKTDEAMASLRQFWRESVNERAAQLRDFPDLEAEPRNTACPNFYVVTRGVALVAHYRGIPLRQLLIPAEPHCDTSQLDMMHLHYEALMPAAYLLKPKE